MNGSPQYTSNGSMLVCAFSVENTSERHHLSFLILQNILQRHKSYFFCRSVCQPCDVKGRGWQLSGISTCGCQPYQIKLTQGELNTFTLSANLSFSYTHSIRDAQKYTRTQHSLSKLQILMYFICSQFLKTTILA